MIVVLFSFICEFCEEGMYKDFVKNECNPCPTGGICRLGLLYNSNGLK